MMTPSTPFHLQHRTGGLAAGREIEHAWILLSDVAFKLFLWLCRHAGLASALQRTESEMRAALDEPFPVILALTLLARRRDPGCGCRAHAVDRVPLM